MGRRHMEGITVHGTGRVSLRPDTATVILGVEAPAKTAGAAQNAGSRRMQSLFVALRGLGVTDEDLATQQISLEAQYDYTKEAPRLTGYLSSQTLLVRVHDLEGLGPLIDTSIEAGAARVNGVTFSVAEPAAAESRARTLAIADARARATTLAEAAGVLVGPATSIVEGGPPRGGQPIAFQRMAMMEKADTPVAAGTTEITVDVDVTFAIEVSGSRSHS